MTGDPHDPENVKRELADSEERSHNKGMNPSLPTAASASIFQNNRFFLCLFLVFFLCGGGLPIIPALAVPLNDPAYPSPLRKALKKASRQISEGNAKGAIELLSPLIKTYPDYTALFTLAGLAYGKTGNHKMVIEMEKRALVLSPRNTSARTSLGIAYGNTGHFRKELREEAEVVHSHPKEEPAWEALGWAYASLGDWRSSRLAEERAVSLNGSDPQARMMLGLALAHQGFLEEALIMERKAQKLSPDDEGIKRSIDYIQNTLHPSKMEASKSHPGFNPLLQPTPGPATSTATPGASQQMSPPPIKAPSVLH
jgi:tetratricopeptide (TPR) repeat protein